MQLPPKTADTVSGRGRVISHAAAVSQSSYWSTCLCTPGVGALSVHGVNLGLAAYLAIIAVGAILSGPNGHRRPKRGAPGSDLRSVDDVIAKARRAELPGYASSGIGTLGHLVAEVAIAQAGVHLNHIPYNTAALPDILAGHVPLASYAWSSVIGQVQAGTLRAIAVSTATRQPDFPDVPTFREQGFDIVASTWFALSGPANMPREIVARLNRDVYRIMERPEVRLRFAQDAIEFKSMTPDELTRLFESEIARWGVVVRDSGLKRG
jgi:tripartite-type tricarboxylate transporter receptor subunit TctC